MKRLTGFHHTCRCCRRSVVYPLHDEALFVRCLVCLLTNAPDPQTEPVPPTGELFARNA
jgi:hypothetical protein